MSSSWENRWTKKPRAPIPQVDPRVTDLIRTRTPHPSQVIDRLSYALIGALLGLGVGVLGWWLYGRAHSLNYSGVALDPALKHWLTGSGILFGALGGVLKDRVGDLIGDALSSIFHFEINSPPRTASAFALVLLLALVLAGLWHTTPVGATP